MNTISINVSDKSSNIRTPIYPPIRLDPTKRHEMALIRLETYNSIPNVDETNNIIRYSIDDVQHDIVIATGAYELSEINAIIQSNLVKPDVFELLANNNTLKSIIRINQSGVKVYFNHENSLKDMLGFRSVVLQELGDNEGSNLVNILKVNSILVKCDVITGSYVNSSQKPVIYSFFPNVPPGYKIVETPGTPIYLPISDNNIESIRLWLTDQNNDMIDLRGETLTVWFVIRSVI